jgi:hypothetical protein
MGRRTGRITEWRRVDGGPPEEEAGVAIATPVSGRLML